METLILGTAVGYQPDQLEPFVISLRKYYSGKVGFLVTAIDQNLKNFFQKYNITPHIITINIRKIKPVHIFNIRHYEYLKIVENSPEINRVFLTDVRDVFFQGNPFDHNASTDLEFFLEPKEIKNCRYNSSNMRNSYGEEFFNTVGDNYIACAGTTMGTKTGIITYLKTMILELQRLEHEKGSMVEDQNVHNYLIYTEKFPSHTKYKTRHGPVATLHHMRKGVFNSNGDIINDDGSLPAVVHQWDRLQDDVKTQIYNKIMSYKE